MAHDDDAGVHNGPDLGRHTHAAFELDSVAAGFLEEPAGVFHGLFDRALVRHEGHIAHDKRVGRPTAHSLGMADALVHGHRHRARVAIDAHPQGIADEQHVHPGGFGELRRGKVVRGEKCDFLPVFLHSEKVVNHQFLLGHS
jgi:hypothetical protein